MDNISLSLISADLIRIIIIASILISILTLSYVIIKRKHKKKKPFIILLITFSILIIYFFPFKTDYCNWDIQFIRITVKDRSFTIDESDAVYEVLGHFDKNLYIRTLRDEVSLIDNVPIIISIFKEGLLGHILIYDNLVLMEDEACEGYIVLPIDNVDYTAEILKLLEDIDENID